MPTEKMSRQDKIALKKQLSSYLPPPLRHHLDDSDTILKHITWLRNMLTTFLPRYLLKLVAQGSVPGQVSDGFRYGTVLFADIAGFTAMSEQLAKLRREGAEEVTSIVNDYFDIMLTISAYNGGDLLKFGGDTLLLFFEGEEGPYQAIFTAQAMQQAMTRFARVMTSRGTFSLQMSIGLGTGSVFLAHLPATTKVEYAVMGPALAKMAQAESQAHARQIVVDQATCDAISDLATFSPAKDGFWLLESLAPTDGSLAVYSQPWEAFQPPTGTSPEKMLDQLVPHLKALDSMRPFVSQELFNQLIVNPQRPLPSSHRPVTVMFVNFYGVDPIVEALGPEHQPTISHILTLHFSSMSRILDHYGGLINKMDSYAIGYRIMALFGAHQVHKDDPQRAVRAALEMNQALARVNQRTLEALAKLELDIDWDEQPLKQRIGINTGFVFAGNVGTLIRREYTVMGNEVNLTTRLMGVAQENEILVSQSTARQVQETFVLSEKPSVKVKGQIQPLRNYAVTGMQERSIQWSRIAAGPIVNRVEALANGRAAVDRARSGHGTLLLISGQPGIGKTRLAEEIVRYGQSMGMDLLVGTCLSCCQTMTYHPWADVFRLYFGIQSIDDQSTREESIRRGMEQIGEEIWTPIIGDVLGLNIPDNDLTQALDAKLRRQRLFDLTISLLQEQVKKRPLILVIEDAQRADPASADLLDYVVRNIVDYPILLILPHQPHQRLSHWSTHPHAVCLSLSDLDNADCLDIVKGMIGPVPLPDSLNQIILSKGEGNPFFIEEVVRALIDAETLQINPAGEWELELDIDSIELPDTIQGLISSRIDRLLEIDQRILQVASVLGPVFAYPALDNLFQESTLYYRLDFLGTLDLIEIHSLDQELYRFQHAMIWEEVKDTLSLEQRRKWHQLIADFVEQADTASPSKRINLLAHHYWEAACWDEAMQYNLLAGQAAQRNYANHTAVIAYQRALESAAKLAQDTQPQQLQAHQSLGETLTLLGQYDQALEHLQAALSLADAPPCQADLCRKTAAVYERRGECETAFDWLEKGLSYLADTKASVESARIYLLGARIYRSQGKNEEAINWSQKSLGASAQLQTRDSQQLKAQAYWQLGDLYTERGNLQSASIHCQKGVHIYQEIDDPMGLGQAYLTLSKIFCDQGNWDRGRETLIKCLELEQQVGDIFAEGIATNNLAQLELDRGDWERAETLFEQSYAIWKRVGDITFKGIAQSNLAQVHLHQGNWNKAHSNLLESQAFFANQSSEEHLPELNRRWAEYHIHTLELDLALTHVQRSLELAAAQKARAQEGISYRVLGQVHLARQENQLARNALEQSAEILQAMGKQFEVERTAVELARLELHSDPLAAGEQLDQAIQTFGKLGARADLIKASLLKEHLA